MDSSWALQCVGLNPQFSCSAELTASCILMWTMCQASGCIWKVERYVDGTQGGKKVKQFGRFWLFSQSPPSFHPCDLQPGTYFWHSTHPSFSHETSMWSGFPQNISLFILFPLFINFISTKARPRGFRKGKWIKHLCVSPSTIHNPNTHSTYRICRNPQHFPLTLLLFLSSMFLVLLVVPELPADTAKSNMAQALWFLHAFSLH